MKINGFLRANQTIGVRNHLLVMPSVICANDVARMIAEKLPGAVYINHEHGCGNHIEVTRQRIKRTLIGYGSNPNVGACIVIGLGCEQMDADEIAGEIAKTGKPVDSIVIQKTGGTVKSVEQGVQIGRKMLDNLAGCKRENFDLSVLTLALECGGSDPTSGIAANPALGVASDLLVENGGTSIISETSEIVGAEHLMAKRAVNREVADQLLEIVSRAERKGLKQGEDMSNLSPGNRAGGLSTVEEKSLGCIHKAGKAPLQEVIEYAFQPSKKGLIVMNTPGRDIVSVTAKVAGGAQVVGFTTGRGTPVGCPIAPVLKICGNSFTSMNMADNIDIDAGVVIEGTKTIPEVGKEIFQEIIDVANGKLTKAEQLGIGDFAIYEWIE